MIMERTVDNVRMPGLTSAQRNTSAFPAYAEAYRQYHAKRDAYFDHTPDPYPHMTAAEAHRKMGVAWSLVSEEASKK